jgi:hypothetical protein
MRNRTLLFGSTHRRRDCHFDYWNQPLKMRVSCLNCYEAGLCCYLVIHIETLLFPLQFPFATCLLTLLRIFCLMFSWQWLWKLFCSGR